MSRSEYLKSWYQWHTRHQVNGHEEQGSNFCDANGVEGAENWMYTELSQPLSF
jgi:hypothetical protein